MADSISSLTNACCALHAAFLSRNEIAVRQILADNEGMPTNNYDRQLCLYSAFKSGMPSLGMMYFTHIIDHVTCLNADRFFVIFGCTMESWQVFLNYADKFVCRFYKNDWSKILMIAFELGLDFYRELLHHPSYRISIFPEFYEIVRMNHNDPCHQYACMFEKRLGIPVFVDCHQNTRNFYRSRNLWDSYFYTFIHMLSQGELVIHDSILSKVFFYTKSYSCLLIPILCSYSDTRRIPSSTNYARIPTLQTLCSVHENCSSAVVEFCASTR